jgi:Ca2+-transporting ATPase
MGKAGTDVTKEAAEMILADDNFATIVAAVEEGRLIFNNIKKFVHFLISCNISEVGTVFLSILLGLPFPLYPIQILWINLITDGAPALALGVDPSDPDLMKRPPRKRDEGVLTPEGLGKTIKQGLVLTLFALLSFFISLKIGFPEEEGRTILFSTLVLSQLFHAYLFRMGKGDLKLVFKNKYLNLSFFFSLFLQLIITYTPLSVFFHAYPLPLAAWLFPFLSSLFALSVNLMLFPYSKKDS